LSTESTREKKPNRLIHEKSPYLLQHAYNPVDWYPWGDEAFAKATAENKPVFVSIGYSTCHWCHVMEKECFDDEEVAKLMNEAFVSIKVDREERPDLDGAYMTVCQAMGRNCGWPLNVIMTPGKNAFYVASYIPKHSRYGSAGMMDLVPQISEIWRTRRGELEQVGEDVKRRIEAFERRQPSEALGKDVLDDAFEKFVLRFDAEHGGFGSAPKFPSPHNLLFLLRYWRRTCEKEALAMVEKTLRFMRLGGIFDQVGFGFHRYSTDALWLVPHFEKMLYDQALLTLAYLEAYQATGAGKFMVTAKEVLEYVLRDLAAPEGGFYSAEDADSEGEEGKFYLWTEQEIHDTLSPEDAELAVKLYAVEARGNFDEPGVGRSGKNILHLAKPLDELASELHLTLDEVIPRLGRIQKTLFDTREKRVHPAKDDKTLTDWNGLMIAALARASRVLGEKRYLDAAVKAADFFLNRMRDKNGTLFHRYVKGERAVEGFLDDYAFLAFGLTEIYETNFDDRFLQSARELTDALVERFWDEQAGGFFFTAKNSENVVARRKEIYDGALPSGNSVALFNLLRLAFLSDNMHYDELAEQFSKTFSAEVRESPIAHTFLLLGVDFAVGPAYNVTIVGDVIEQSTKGLLDALRANYLPNALVSVKPASKLGFGFEQIDGKATAYVCRGQTCLPPANDAHKMLELLDVQSKVPAKT
jgi:uncharacterized protein YyaL (SSP411 family)